MDILLINWRCPKNPLAGGAEVYAFEIFKRIAKKGHRVTFLSERYANSPCEEEENGIKIIRIGKNLTFNYHVYCSIKKIVKASNFDIVIDDLNKIPFYSPWIIKDRPVLAILMHLFREAIFYETVFPLASYVYLSEKMIPLAYKHNYFAVLSQSTKEDLIKLYKGRLAENKIEIVPPGIESTRYKPDFSKKRERIICHVGRLKKYKSVDHLLKAVKILSSRRTDFKVLVVGQGDDAPRLKSICSQLGINDFVEFTGFVSEEEKIDIYQRSLFLVENSIKEGWGLTVMEANACGTPVIASKTPGLKDAVKESETGLFYPYGDIPALVKKIDLLLSDDELREKLSQRGVEWASSFTWEKASDKMMALIEKAVQ